VNDADFDRFVAPLDYPMFVLTVPASAEGDRSGCLVGFSTQCSIAPPRFLVGLSKLNHTFRSAAHVSIAALHLLEAGDHDLAVLFGTTTTDKEDKFQHCSWSEGPAGVPLLTRCANWLVGDILERIDLGDHQGLLLQPTEVGPGATSGPLMFSTVRDLEAGHPA
jgi:flavin reductase (DIM6/NTAB) family NADH-FMN oxidoreductase RutF